MSNDMIICQLGYLVGLLMTNEKFPFKVKSYMETFLDGNFVQQLF